VRGEVLHDVDVVANGTKVGARRVHVLGHPEVAALQTRLDEPYTGVVHEHVAVDQRPLCNAGSSEQRPRVLNRRAHRFFEQHMLAGFERGGRQLEMRPRRRRDDHRIHVAPRQHVVRRGNELEFPVEISHLPSAIGGRIGGDDDACAGGLAEDADVIGPPVSEADHPDADRFVAIQCRNGFRPDNRPVLAGRMRSYSLSASA
jgi:hypothetical protein